ncbi:unnamed protein product [Rotaria magnacalcarata]
MDKYRQSPPTIANTLVGWIVNLSMQTILQMFHPIYSPHQQYTANYAVTIHSRNNSSIVIIIINDKNLIVY